MAGKVDENRAWDWGNRVTMKMLSFGDEWADEIAEFERITNDED